MAFFFWPNGHFEDRVLDVLKALRAEIPEAQAS